MDTKDKTRKGTAASKPRSGTGKPAQKTGTQAQRRPAATVQKVKAKPAGTAAKTASAPRASAKTGAKTAARQAAAETARKTAASRSRSASRPVRKPKVEIPDVVYTAPNPFSGSGFLLRLISVVAVVVALTFGISIFFKVEHVQVSGIDKYSAWTVKEASGIQVGENLLMLNKPRAVGKILAALPYADDVRIGIKLPDTVNIEIKEIEVAYSIRDGMDQWWLMTAEGKVIEKVDNATAGEYTKILGVKLNNPIPGEQAVAMEASSEPESTDETTGIVVTLPQAVVMGRDRLTAALSIVQYLEEYEIIGDVVSVDVETITAMELWYGQKFQVKLGDTTQLGFKLEQMKGAIQQMASYQSGVLDCSFTTWPDKVGYTPFA